MEDPKNIIDSLLERAADYGKTSYELVKLKVIDKASNGLSSIVPNTIVVILLITFFLFLNFGVAFWLGEILGQFFYGFFIVAAFYGLLTVILHVFLRKWLKKTIYDYIIRQILK